MTPDPREFRVLFAGGGTGGHIHPNLAILERLRALDPAIHAHFIVSNRPIDARVMQGEPAAWTASTAAPMSSHPKGLWRFLRNWAPSLRAARALMRDLRPVALVTTGGFVSAPVARAARIEGVPIILIALDDPPGKASRLIARRADRRLIATLSGTPSGWEKIAPIVRLRAIASGTPAECRRRLDLDPTRPTLFITGGSQGARSLNDALIHLAPSLPDLLPGWQILHQCGTNAVPRLESAYGLAGVPYRVVEYLPAMGDAWGAADLAIARAGAGTVAEVACNAVPTIFLPYPYHADRHQERNARPLVHARGALVIDDTTDAARTAPVLAREISELLAHASALQTRRENLKNLTPGDGAQTVAKIILSLDADPSESDG